MKYEEAVWSLEDGRYVTATLEKRRKAWWKCAVQGDKMILIGGNKAGAESGQAETWLFDLKSNQWESAKLSVRRLKYKI